MRVVLRLGDGGVHVAQRVGSIATAVAGLTGSVVALLLLLMVWVVGLGHVMVGEGVLQVWRMVDLLMLLLLQWNVVLVVEGRTHCVMKRGGLVLR